MRFDKVVKFIFDEKFIYDPKSGKHKRQVYKVKNVFANVTPLSVEKTKAIFGEVSKNYSVIRTCLFDYSNVKRVVFDDVSFSIKRVVKYRKRLSFFVERVS
ncbi:MAG: hypothetical protein PUG22_04560 [Peptoniphilaceae bacterium]|nr:hypothetical protein [Peptoniphilaceae bacterium]